MADGRSCDEVDRGWLDDNYRSCACTSQGKGRIGAGVGDFFWGGGFLSVLSKRSVEEDCRYETGRLQGGARISRCVGWRVDEESGQRTRRGSGSDQDR